MFGASIWVDNLLPLLYASTEEEEEAEAEWVIRKRRDSFHFSSLSIYNCCVL